MPQIKPTLVKDLIEFVQDQRSDIKNGMYDIQIQDLKCRLAFTVT